ncbi:hypothetical protein R3I94_004911 [Phoxinus phoxinus]
MSMVRTRKHETNETKQSGDIRVSIIEHLNFIFSLESVSGGKSDTYWLIWDMSEFRPIHQTLHNSVPHTETCVCTVCAHTAKGLRGGSAAEVSRLPERTRETDPYRRPLARSDGSATKADRGPAVAPYGLRSASAIIDTHPPRTRNGLKKQWLIWPGSILDPFI